VSEIRTRPASEAYREGWDRIFGGRCPLDHTPNATTIAAIEAVERGEVEPYRLEKINRRIK
jgi:hypothetical protein